ncbi:hypothetical protein CBS147339_9026 [Penicillium roqueforti]|nr:uncharacterized protein LCP9604111_9046 [Penicillium roqueforti]KAF9239769.1 hypothetical protein LCP9604111_9046 [Penicillium roqueforti]KAI2765322.1 hypothetical protein DTO012A8_9457 [Penicillium roqueforti]KAI3065556.1 hypothetical protein CBS147339_9026 [Penicillium roqueforti]KAI3099679.1 hypothetical protein CBS147338_3650 [Penicillium roqueforti]KAI3116372.1 hypothetical protein CBS147330_9675 [Penicillium roqueforti]
MKQPFSLSRGGCTDSTWRSSRCTDICVKAQGGAGSAVVWLDGSENNATYCCNSVLVDPFSGEKICSNVDGATQTSFKILDGYIIPSAGVLSNFEEISNNTSSFVANGTDTAVTTAVTTAATTPVPTATATATASNENSCNESREIAIGAGVGVPLAAIALLSIGWAFWERRNRKLAALPAAQPTPLFQPSYQVARGHESYHAYELKGSPPKPAELYTA